MNNGSHPHKSNTATAPYIPKFLPAAKIAKRWTSRPIASRNTKLYKSTLEANFDPVRNKLRDVAVDERLDNCNHNRDVDIRCSSIESRKSIAYKIAIRIVADRCVREYIREKLVLDIVRIAIVERAKCTAKVEPPSVARNYNTVNRVRR